MYEIEATFKGLVPMMHDRFFNPEELEGANKKSKNFWKKELELKCYKDSKGVFLPADNIRMMLIGNRFRKGAAYILGSYIEKKKGTEYLQFAKSCIWVLGKNDPLKVYIEPKRKTFNEYDERTFINAAGSRSITRRPLITLPWSLPFIIQVTDESFHESKVKEFFDVAGLRCGAGAYGPTFGRCIISSWEKRKTKRKK